LITENDRIDKAIS